MKINNLKNVNDAKTTYEYYHVLTEDFEYIEDYNGVATLEAGHVIKVDRTLKEYTKFPNRYYGTIPATITKVVRKKKTVTTAIEIEDL